MGSNPYTKPADAGSGVKKAVAGERVLLGLSGGPASTATALILQEQGYSVEAVYFDFSTAYREQRGEFGCVQARRKSAEASAEKLHIPLKILPADGYFQQKVISPLQENAIQALAFDPCSSCHSRFRMEALYSEARDRGIDWIATGHFVRISKEPDLGISLWRSKDVAWDQSFVLSRTRAIILKSLITPMGHLKSADVNRMLDLRDIPLQLPKSNELFCTSSLGLGPKYLAKRAEWSLSKERKAYAVSVDMKAMAEIKGGGELCYYWGQSEGLDYIKQEALLRGFKGASKYVITAVDPVKHYVYAGGEGLLKRKEIVLENVHWIVAPDLRKRRTLTFASRGQRVDGVAVEALIDNAVHLKVTEEGSAFQIAPGDLGVLYDKELCMGSGEVYSGF